MAVVLPGTASTGEFLLRAFGPALAALGIGLVGGDGARDGDLDARMAELDEAVEEFRPVLVGGVSIGAHVAARWASGRLAASDGCGPAAERRPGSRDGCRPGSQGGYRPGPADGYRPGLADEGRPGPANGRGPGAPDGYRPEGLLLAMPAWTGAPGPVAAASAVAADEVARDGVAAALRRIRAAAAPESRWVVEELAAAWPAYSDRELAATLRATAAAAGPSADELGAVGVPCGVAVLRDDALHPAAVGRAWAEALPRAAVVETGLAAVGADRATLGRAAALAWLRARAAP